MGWGESEEEVGLALNVHINGHLVEEPEEGGEEGGELLAVDGFVAVHVEEVEEVLDVVAGRLLPAHHVDEGLQHPRELVLRESVVFVLVELVKQFL